KAYRLRGGWAGGSAGNGSRRCSNQRNIGTPGGRDGKRETVRDCDSPGPRAPYAYTAPVCKPDRPMKRTFRIPHTLALLFIIMAGALVATWLLPQGEFQTAQDGGGRAVVVPGTYEQAEERVTLSPLTLFTVVPRAMA